MTDIAGEYAFAARQKRMPKAAGQEADPALSAAVKKADRYGRGTVVRFIGNTVNGIVKQSG